MPSFDVCLCHVCRTRDVAVWRGCHGLNLAVIDWANSTTANQWTLKHGRPMSSGSVDVHWSIVLLLESWHSVYILRGSSLLRAAALLLSGWMRRDWSWMRRPADCGSLRLMRGHGSSRLQMIRSEQWVTEEFPMLMDALGYFPFRALLLVWCTDTKLQIVVLVSGADNKMKSL